MLYYFVPQARNYLQALPYKPTVPWSRLFPKAGPKGMQGYISLVLPKTGSIVSILIKVTERSWSSAQY